MCKPTIFQLVFFLFFSLSVDAQGCLFDVSPVQLEICPGDSACMTASSGNLPGTTIEQCDFNSSTIPAGWNISGGTPFGQPCAPSLTGTDYFWSSASGANTPFVISSPVDVSFGGVVKFDLVYAFQGVAPPCEGPDTWNEGVQFQYSVDGGVSWVNIAYFNPDGTMSTSQGGTVNGATAFTSWDTYCFAIPPAAQTLSTLFRWTQEVSSGANFDNWGLDEIVIANNLSGITVNWSNGAINATTLCTPVWMDTTFTAYLINSIGDTLYQAQTNVNVFSTSSVTDTVNVCTNSDYTFADGTIVMNISADTTYTSVFQDANGCDSTITTTVIPTTIVSSVVQTDSTLSAQNSGPNVTYSWVDCDNAFQAIPGETSQVFVPTLSGSYAVVVTENGCSDTSSCFTMSLAKVNKLMWFEVDIYPNPTTENFTIDFDDVYRNFTVHITDGVGKNVFSQFYDAAQSIEIQLDGDPGIYFVEVGTSDSRMVQVLIKQ